MRRSSSSTAPTSEDFFRPHQRLATYAGRLLPDVHPERALFPGFSPLVLSAVALVPPIGQMRLAFTAGLLVAGDMTQGLNGSLYPFLYDVFPPIRGMRVPARFSILLGIALAVLASFGVRRLLARCRTRATRALAFAGMTALVLVDLRPKLELMPVWREPPPIYDVLKDAARAGGAGRVSVRAESAIRHERDPVHVFLDVALAADGERLQRILSVRPRVSA